MLPATTTRVQSSTPDSMNDRIDRKIEASVRHHAAHPEMIDGRLRELASEWDVERTLEANAATLALTGVLLGAAVHKRWLYLPAVVTGLLLQHAIQGWCPPIPVLRVWGIRTSTEINRERVALKALRGDFRHLGDGGDVSGKARAALRAASA